MSSTKIPTLKRDDLCEEFPSVFESAEYVDVGIGWLDIIRRFITDALPLDPALQVVELKEKFGALRILHDSDVDEVVLLQRLAESRSAYACEICGRDGEIRLPPPGQAGWRKCLCPDHMPDLMRDWLPPRRPPAWPMRGRWYEYDRESDSLKEVDVPERWKR
ncbi:hypothetical protein [Gellertiella hungarica]|uniref:Uncharacterized protein n=1 Tax=Gellertiella hungarica TaxID=1572859 RepID=A0A7W6NK50_9HYPH|nr:hypothetical protein [Gellertiella hungarica]MBB4064015.1 hypothetical protein [Gellertiella hungarica]